MRWECTRTAAFSLATKTRLKLFTVENQLREPTRKQLKHAGIYVKFHEHFRTFASLACLQVEVEFIKIVSNGKRIFEINFNGKKIDETLPKRWS